jgi:hypothetical protein
LYYYTGFALIQDMVDKALITRAANITNGGGSTGTGVGGAGDTSGGAFNLPTHGGNGGRTTWQQQQQQQLESMAVFAQQMPIPPYVSDLFAAVIGTVLPLVLTLSWIHSFTSLVKGLVHERENRVADTLTLHGMLLGVNTVAWWISTMVGYIRMLEFQQCCPMHGFARAHRRWCARTSVCQSSCPVQGIRLCQVKFLCQIFYSCQVQCDDSRCSSMAVPGAALLCQAADADAAHVLCAVVVTSRVQRTHNCRQCLPRTLRSSQHTCG